VLHHFRSSSSFFGLSCTSLENFLQRFAEPRPEITTQAGARSESANLSKRGPGARAHLCALRSSDRAPERFERCAHLGHEDLRLLPGSEVGAFGELVVVDELHIRFLCPALRRLINFFRERAHGDWKLDASRVEGF
jgi:hypothetical protein